MLDVNVDPILLITTRGRGTSADLRIAKRKLIWALRMADLNQNGNKVKTKILVQ